MRTTLTLDPDVAARAKQGGARLGRPLKEIINAALRVGLDEVLRPPAPKVYRTHPRPMGLRAGLSYDNVAELSASAESEDHLCPSSMPIYRCMPKTAFSDRHEAAREWSDAQLSGIGPVCLCWPVLKAFGVHPHRHQPTSPPVPAHIGRGLCPGSELARSAIGPSYSADRPALEALQETAEGRRRRRESGLGCAPPGPRRRTQLCFVFRRCRFRAVSRLEVGKPNPFTMTRRSDLGEIVGEGPRQPGPGGGSQRLRPPRSRRADLATARRRVPWRRERFGQPATRAVWIYETHCAPVPERTPMGAYPMRCGRSAPGADWAWRRSATQQLGHLSAGL